MRKRMQWVVVLAAAALAAPAAQSQGPDRPMMFVVGASPGGGVDRTARILAQQLAARSGLNVVVENRPGAGTRLAGDFVAKAAPDGNTLFFTTGESTVDLAFDAHASPNVLRDFMPVTRVAVSPTLLVVRASSPLRSVGDVVARARAEPGKLNYSTAGIKTTMHLVGEIFKRESHADVVHIPYKGSVPALTALIGGDVDMTFVSLASALPYLDSGQLRAIAVADTRRSSLLPDVPTFAEAGVPGVVSIIWYGILAPTGTPAAVIDRLARAVDGVSSSAAYRQQLATMAAEPAPTSPAEFATLLRDDVAAYARIIRSADIRPE
jgi:tripartite-type tricarboxylate transporter receptor subunit TctC